jgi:hypothetical protein
MSQRHVATATIYSFGVWRSLVAHLHGVQGVVGSNPITPTNTDSRYGDSGH